MASGLSAWLSCTAALVLGLAAAGPVMGQGELAEGTRALYRGDFEAAATRAGGYLRAHPEAVAAEILLARAHVAQGNYLAAYAELQTALHTDPRNIDALYYLGSVCRILAQDEYLHLLAMAPDSRRVHQLLAQSYELQGDTAKAEAEYMAALKANPQSVEFLDALGDLERRQYKFDEAVSYYSRAREIEPGDYDSAYGLGACYLFQHNPQGAIEHFRRAVSTDPTSVAARFALGDALLRANQPAAAVTELKAAAALEPKMRQAYTLLARAYTRLGQTREAEEALKKEEALDRGDIEWREEILHMGRAPSAPSNPPPAEDSAPKQEH